VRGGISCPCSGGGTRAGRLSRFGLRKDRWLDDYEALVGIIWLVIAKLRTYMHGEGLWIYMGTGIDCGRFA
jgi:hypothetical protein